MNTLAVSTATRRPVPAFLTYGFRPFFLAAGLWSASALLLWIVMFATGSTIPSRFDPLAWHVHEMLFGFVMAWILSRTNVPGRRLFEQLMIMPYYLTPLLGALAWGLLGAPESGFINEIWRALGGLLLVGGVTLITKF